MAADEPTSSPSGNSFSVIDLIRVAWLPPGSRAPDRAGEQHVADMGEAHFVGEKYTPPGEWPGRCRMSKLSSPIST